MIVQPASTLHSSPEILYVAFDTADYNICSKLATESPQSAFLAIGNARTRAEENHVVHIYLQQLGIGPDLDIQHAWKKEKDLKKPDELPIEDIRKIAQQVLPTRAVVLGVPSKILGQLGRVYHQEHGLKVYWIWDNPNVDTDSPYGQTAMQVQDVPGTQVFVMSEEVGRAIDPTLQRTIVVGSPGIDLLVDQLRNLIKLKDAQVIDHAHPEPIQAIQHDVALAKETRQAILDKYGLDGSKPILVYFGGADEVYPKALNLFKACLEALDPSIAKDVQIIVTTHPAVKAKQYEWNALHTFEPKFKRLLINSTIKNEEAILVAQAFLTFNSSMIDQMRYIFSDKPCAVVVPTDVHYKGTLEQLGYIHRLDTENKLSTFLDQLHYPSEKTRKDLSSQVKSGSLQLIKSELNNK